MQDGFRLELWERLGSVAIYKKSKLFTPIESWEVVKIGTRSEKQAFGRVFPASETYPSSEQWGDRGWTCTTKEDADKKFEQWCEEDRLKVYLKKELEMRKAASL